MAIEHLATRDNPENNAVKSALTAGLSAEDNRLLMHLRASASSGTDQSLKSLPEMIIGHGPDASPNAYVKIGSQLYSNAEIAKAAESAGSESFLQSHPALRITDQGDSIDIISGA